MVVLECKMTITPVVRIGMLQAVLVEMKMMPLIQLLLQLVV